MIINKNASLERLEGVPSCPALASAVSESLGSEHPAHHCQIMDKIIIIIFSISWFSSGYPQYKNSVFARDMR